MINWPAVIKHSDDAELIHVRGQAQWDDDADLNSFDYNEADYLIDSSGYAFDITNKVEGIVRPRASGLVIDLKSILGLVKAHAAQSGSCCVAKLYAPTIEEAYKIVESLD
ncbi:MAG: DUF4144 domain-containing protein [Gammaproteobacteria bacterium]|nr:DUF4144 domain-containing protein [Gammaproteobacteria bacterium]